MTRTHTLNPLNVFGLVFRFYDLSKVAPKIGEFPMLGSCKRMNEQMKLAKIIHLQLHDSNWQWKFLDKFLLNKFILAVLILLSILGVSLVIYLLDLKFGIHTFLICSLFIIGIFVVFMAYAIILDLYMHLVDVCNYYWCLADFGFRPHQNCLGLVRNKRSIPAHSEMGLIAGGFYTLPYMYNVPTSHYLSVEVEGSYFPKFFVIESVYKSVSYGDSICVTILTGRYSKRMYLQKVWKQ